MRGRVFAGFFRCTSESIKICYLLQKIHFIHLQQYNKRRRVYLARIQHHSQQKKAGGNVATHAQNGIIYNCITDTSG